MDNILNTLRTIKAIIKDVNVDNIALDSSVKYLEYCVNMIEIKDIVFELSRHNYNEALLLINKYLIENDDSDIIYHYCSVENLYNIINSKVLWLSDSDYMNDKFEGRWVDKVFEDMDIPNNSIVSNNIKKRYEKLEVKKQYIFCLSKNGDKLSQWRGYADDGKGIAIGFSKNELGLSYLVNEVNDKNIFTVSSGLIQVIYNKNEQESLIEEIVSSIEEIEEIDNRLLLIKELSNKYKNPSFEEEDEVRIIHIPKNYINANKFSAIKYRISNGSIVGYCEFDLTELGDYKPTLIPKIILGPKCNIQESDLKQFLQSYGLSKTEIISSTSSYR